MPQSLAQLYVHLIFSTKNREAWLTKGLDESLCAYLGGIFREISCPVLVVGGMPDHVHVLFSQARDQSLADIVKTVKTGSSRWMKDRAPHLREFYWQNGYGAFSVSASRINAVKKYIQGQPEHHRKTTFQEEFRKFLKEYHIEWDERYVWD